MKLNFIRLYTILILTLTLMGFVGVTLPVIAAPMPTPGPDPLIISPITHSQTTALTSRIAITYNQPLKASSVTSRTFAVQAKQTGGLAGSLSVQNSTISFTPTHPFKAGEFVQVSATTRTLNITGTEAMQATVWQFRGAVKASSGKFGDSGQRLNSITNRVAQWGDFNQDGHLDLLLGDVIWLNNSSAKLSDSGYRLGYTTMNAVDFADVDSDGDLDALVVMPTSAASTSILGSQIWLNNGLGKFSKSSLTLNFSTDGLLADLDGDGDMDALLGATIWRNNGAGNFILSTQTLGINDGAVAAGDLDNDGDLDAMNSNQIWLNDGSGQFILSGLVGQAASGKTLLADLNQDNFLDAFLIEAGTLQSTAWLNDGHGNLTQIGEQIRDIVPHTLALGDLEGDGDLDFFLARTANETDQTWFNEGNSNFISSPQSLGLTDSRAVALGDVDGDGDLDAVVGNFNQPSRLWLNDAPPDVVVQQNAITSPTLLTYTLTVSNLGATIASGTILVDQLPTYSEFVSVNRPYDYNPALRIITITLPDLLPNGQTSVNLVARLTALPADTTHVTNTATLQLEEEVNLANNKSSHSFMPQAEADLTVSSSNNKAMLRPSDKLTYTITVRNNGGRDAVNISLIDQLPDLMTLLTASDGITAINQQLTWQIDRLGAGQTISRTISLQINKSLPAGTDFLTNTVTLSYIPNPFTTAVITKQAVEADVVVALFDLTLSQSDERNIVYSNEMLTYTLTIQNNGTQDATEVNLSDTLPDMVEFVSATGGGSFDNGLLTWDNLAIAAETSLTQSFQVRVLTPTLGLTPLTNTAIVKATLPDPTPSNNIVTDINFIKITGTAKLTLTVDAPSLATVGETIIYTITVSHAPDSSQSPIKAVSLTSNLLPNLTPINGDDALDTGESWLYTGSYTVQINNPPQISHYLTVQALDLNNDKVTASTVITTAVPIVPLRQVIMSGALTGTLGLTYSFTATVSPTTVTPPLNYIWQITDQSNIIHNNRTALSDTVQLSWATVGVKQVTVNVINADSLVIGTQSFTVRGPDTPPSIRDVIISPNPPKDDANLDIFYTYTDPEGDKEGDTQIRWSVNGVARLDLNNLKTITASLTQPDESWCAVITPYDNHGIAGTTTAPNCVTIVRNPFICQANNVQLLSVPQNSDLPRLKLNYTVSCPQRQLAQTDIRWYRNGTFQPGLNNRTDVLSDFVVAREAWTATVAACSEKNGCESPVTSNVVYVTEKPNTPPVATISLSPTMPLDRDNLTVKITISDSDTAPRQSQYQTQIRWYRDGTLNPAFNNQTTLSGAETYQGETWCVVVQPYDGLDYGAATEPLCVMIGSTSNHAPQIISVTLGATRPKEGTALTLSYQYQDIDSDIEATRQVRWYRNDQLQPAFNNLTQIPATATLAGDIWQVKVRVHDGKMYSLWVTSEAVNITGLNRNTPPVAIEAEIKQSSDNHLILAYRYHDVDGQQEKNTRIYWYNNPFTRTTKFDGLTVIPASETNPNEVWYARIIPEDGQVYGEATVANSVQALQQQNSPPYVRTVLIDPAHPAVDDNLKLQYIYLDPDGDIEGNTVLQWELNGLKQSTFDGKNIVSANFTDLADKWCAFVTPVDLRGAVGETKSVCVVVGETQNTLPEILGQATIEPSIARDNQEINLKYTYYDADGDLEDRSQIRWFKIAFGGNANELQSAFNDQTVVPASATQPGERWFATISVHDGKNYSAAMQTTSATLINHPPQAEGLKLVPDNARANQRIRVSYTFTDVDTTTVSINPEVRWFINGEHQADQDDETSFREKVTKYNDVLSVTLRPNDGTEYGNIVTTSVKIGPPPEPIYLPLLIKIVRPIDPTPTHTPTATPTPPSCSPQSRYEPNNVQAEACEIKLGELIEQTYPNDVTDEFYFVLTETTSVMIEVTNYKKGSPEGFDGMLRVFDEFNTHVPFTQIQYLKDTGTILPDTNYPKGLKNLPPGKYYIWVYTYANSVNPNDPYTLQVKSVIIAR